MRLKHLTARPIWLSMEEPPFGSSQNGKLIMFAITGATGKVGRAMAQALLDAGEAVRIVARDPARASDWAAKGCEIAVAAMEDGQDLSGAFQGTEGVFVLPPPEFDPAPGYPEAGRVIHAVVSALEAARPPRVVCLSTVGADATEDNLLSQRTLMEQALAQVDLPITLLRPAWFLDNIEWDIPSARDEGVLHSFLRPIDRAIPMVAARDVGAYAAQLIRESWDGIRVLGIEGPEPVSPADSAKALERALGRPVRVEVLQRAAWEELFRAQGMRNPLPRMRMLDGFNDGWIDFDRSAIAVAKGKTDLDAVLSPLIAA